MSNRLTGKLATECPSCEGIGYTSVSAPEMETRAEEFSVWKRRGTEYRLVTVRMTVEVRTIKRGSGCLRCKGTGQL